MLTQLDTLKSRLQILVSDHTQDTLLVSAIAALSARFDRECRRNLFRTIDAHYEFPAEETEIAPPCYPVEALLRCETKTDEVTGWTELAAPDYIIHKAAVIILSSALGVPGQLARVTYTGGYVPPGTGAAPGQTPLPPELETAAIEQIAFWFHNRDKQGLKILWPSSEAYQSFATFDLLPSVQAVLSLHRRWTL